MELNQAKEQLAQTSISPVESLTVGQHLKEQEHHLLKALDDVHKAQRHAEKLGITDVSLREVWECIGGFGGF